MSKIRAIIKRPDEEYGHVTHISVSLENLQRTVGGYIETVVVTINGKRVVLILNEEGKLLNLEPNMGLGDDMLVGTIIAVGDGGEDFTDLPISFDAWKRFVMETAS